MQKSAMLATVVYAQLSSAACERNDSTTVILTPQELCGDMLSPAPNPSGLAQSATSSGDLDLQSPFFASLGTNGRSCGTCHQPFRVPPPRQG